MSVYERYDNAAGEKHWHYRKRVTLPDGRKVRISGTPAMNTKRAAEEAERAHVDRTLHPPAPVVVAKPRHRMSDVFDRFLTDYVAIANNKSSERAAKTTMVNRYLRPELGELYADEVTAAAIETLAAKLHRTTSNRKDEHGEHTTLSAKWVKNILQTLRKCLNWAERLELVDDVPEIQMPRVDEAEVRYLEADELDALLAVMALEPLWFAAAILAADAGLRQGELRALKWTSINEVTNKIVIADSMWRQEDSSTKSRKPRSVPITTRLRAALHAIRVTKLRGPYVISKSNGTPFGAEHMNDTIARFVRAAKLSDDVRWHTLRHTWITRMAMLGVPARTIQKLAGHASLTTTMRYMHVVAGAEDEAIARLDRETVARVGHGTGKKLANGAEDPDSSTTIAPLRLVTPKGLEP